MTDGGRMVMMVGEEQAEEEMKEANFLHLRENVEEKLNGEEAVEERGPGEAVTVLPIKGDGQVINEDQDLEDGKRLKAVAIATVAKTKVEGGAEREDCRQIPSGSYSRLRFSAQQGYRQGHHRDYKSHQWGYERGYWQGHQGHRQGQQGYLQSQQDYQQSYQESRGSEFRSGQKANGDSDVTDTESKDELAPKRDSVVEDSSDDTQLNVLLGDFSSLSVNDSGSPANTSSSSINVQNSPAGEHTLAKVSVSRDIKLLRKIVKSPSKQATTFSRADAFIPQAMAAFEDSIKVNQGENFQAVYDLALLHKALGEWDNALRLLDSIQQGRQRNMRPFEKINAFEQSGLILKEMSEQESNEEKRKLLQEKGESKLNIALLLCSKLCNRLPRLQHFIQHVWHSFPILIQAAERSHRDDTDKLLEKARLYQLIKDNQRSMDLLQEIQDIAPKEAESPDFLKMSIENYVHLKRYDRALAFIEFMKNTAQHQAIDLFEDRHYVEKVYMQAGKAALLNTTAADSTSKAGFYFSTAFRDALSDVDTEMTSGSEDVDSTERGEDSEWSDVFLLYDESAEDKAKPLAQILEEACGLRVTRMAEDCLPGRLELESVSSVMSRSKQVVVLAGGRDVSRQLRLLIGKAVKRQSTVALLVEGDHVPKLLRSTGQRYMVCPQQLLNGGGGGGGGGGDDNGDGDDCGGGGMYTEVEVQAVFDVFSFLTGIHCV